MNAAGEVEVQRTTYMVAASTTGFNHAQGARSPPSLGTGSFESQAQGLPQATPPPYRQHDSLPHIEQYGVLQSSPDGGASSTAQGSREDEDHPSGNLGAICTE